MKIGAKKTTFFSQKSPRILNFWNKFLNPHIKPVILAGKINFSPGAKISWRLVQKWPRYKKKTQRWALKTFFLKNPPGFWTFESSSWILTSNRFFGRNQYIGTLFCPKVPSRASVSVRITCPWYEFIKCLWSYWSGPNSIYAYIKP